MRASEQRDGSFVLTMTRDELRIVNNSVNETLEALDDDEYSTRVGATRDEARALRREFRVCTSAYRVSIECAS